MIGMIGTLFTLSLILNIFQFTYFRYLKSIIKSYEENIIKYKTRTEIYEKIIDGMKEELAQLRNIEKLALKAKKIGQSIFFSPTIYKDIEEKEED